MQGILIEGTVDGDVAMYSDRGLYPKKNGLYLFDDKVGYTLVDVTESTASYIGAVPRDCVIKEYERIGERDIDLLQKQLAELNKGIHDVLDMQSDMTPFNEIMRRLSELNVSKKNDSQGIDLAGLTKLIAVAQKPDLLKGK